MNEDPSLDPIEVAKVLAGIALSPKIAAIVGPYALILLVALAGAGLALGNRKKTERGSSYWFIAWTTIVSVAFCVPVASVAAKYVDGSEVQWFFLPAAFFLSYLGDRWKEWANSLALGVKDLLRNWLNRGQSND